MQHIPTIYFVLSYDLFMTLDPINNAQNVVKVWNETTAIQQMKTIPGALENRIIKTSQEESYLI